MFTNLILLTDLSYEIGLIGAAEYIERMEIADWLSSGGEHSPDPRAASHEGGERDRVQRESPSRDNGDGPSAGGKNNGHGSSAESDDSPPFLQFLAINTWMFTVGDRDCYPSVPHGHFKRKTTEWPKLNPYTGRAFSSMHCEDTGYRLTRGEMVQLWDDPSFVEHCRNQVLWYSDFAPRYTFPNARRGKLVFPNWR